MRRGERITATTPLPPFLVPILIFTHLVARFDVVHTFSNSPLPFRFSSSCSSDFKSNNNNNADVALNLWNPFRSSGGGTTEKEKKNEKKTTDLSPNVESLPILTKERPLIRYDNYVSGRYVSPPPPTTNGAASQQQKQQIINNKDETRGEEDGWNSFKDAFYSSIDVIGSLKEKTTSFAPKNNGNQKKELLGKMPDVRGYAEYGTTIEYETEITVRESGETPGSILLKEYEQQKKKKSGGSKKKEKKIEVGRVGGGTLFYASPTQRKREISRSTTGKEEEDYFRTDARKSFDSAKDFLYEIFDTIGKFFLALTSKVEEAGETMAMLSGSTDDVRPIPIGSGNEDENAILRRLLPELQSNNIFVRYRAESAVRRIERRRKQRLEEEERKRKWEGTKASFYKVVDGVKSTGEVLSTVPTKVVSVAEGTKQLLDGTVKAAKGLPVQLDNTIEDVKALPAKVEQTATDVKTNVDNTIQFGKDVVDTVKAVPSTVQQTVEETKEAATNTKNKIEELTTSVKVMAGIEKPQPKPPKVAPPPPESASDVAWKVANTVASAAATGVGKGVWFVTKGVVGLGYVGVKAGFDTLKEQGAKKMKERQEKKKKREEEVLTVQMAKPTTPTTTKQTKEGRTQLKEIDADLGTEVEEALKLAMEALQTTSTETDTINAATTKIQQAKDAGLDPKVVSEIQDALKRAREAAYRATKDAEEVEDMLKGKT